MESQGNPISYWPRIWDTAIEAVPRKAKEGVWSFLTIILGAFLQFLTGGTWPVLSWATLWPICVSAIWVYLGRFVWFYLGKLGVGRKERAFVLFVFVVGLAPFLFSGNLSLPDKSESTGEYLGEFTVKIGQDVTVAASELYIAFTFKGEDSIATFPKFDFQSVANFGDAPNMKVGQAFLIHSLYYNYTIRMVDFEANTDTFAIFKVYVSDFPKSAKSLP